MIRCSSRLICCALILVLASDANCSRCFAREPSLRQSLRAPLGPDDLPAQLPGRWKVSLCISSEHNHAWIRFENVQSGEVRTISRFHLLVGGWFDGERLRWNYPPTLRAGVYMDREQRLEEGVRNGKYVLLSTYVNDPIILRGDNDGRGHGMIANNCCTYSRDAWYHYSGELYPLHETVHEPHKLLEVVMRRHPEVLKTQQ